MVERRLRRDRPRLGARAARRSTSTRCSRACRRARGPRRSPRSRRWPTATSRAQAGTPDFLWVRALAIEAFYSDFVAPGVDADRRLGGDRLQHSSRHAAGEGLVVPGHRMSERFDVVVVGSGAGGGVVAGELAERGRRVLLLECGPHLTAADFTRWEAKATHDLFWPMRFALIDGGAGGAVALLGGRCVGGSHDDQHEGGAARARQGSRQVACGRRADGQRRRALRLVRPRAALRPRRGAPRRARAQRLAEERAHGRARLPRRSAPSSSRCARTPTATACAAARASRAARRTPASRRSTPTSTTPGPPGGSSCAPARTSSAS